MKKALLVIASFLFVGNVHAIEECKPYQIDVGIEALKNVSYTLEYDKDYIDEYAELMPGYFAIKFANMPDGYGASIGTDDDLHYIDGPGSTARFAGGVYKIRYYSNTCTSVIRTEEIKVPFYKRFCGIEGKCEDDVFFDGTYENTASNQETKPKNKISTRLVIILVILIIVIALFIIVVIIRRRRGYEKDF